MSHILLFCAMLALLVIAFAPARAAAPVEGPAVLR